MKEKRVSQFVFSLGDVLNAHLAVRLQYRPERFDGPCTRKMRDDERRRLNLLAKHMQDTRETLASPSYWSRIKA